MGKNTKIVCTVVPNPYKTKMSEVNGAPKQYYFSIFLTPRLPESGKLKDYYEIVNWPEFFEFFRGFSNGEEQFLRARIAPVNYDKVNSEFEISEESRHEFFDIAFVAKSVELIDEDNKELRVDAKKIYKKLFQNATPVTGWLLSEGDPSGEMIRDILSLQDIRDSYRGHPYEEEIGKLIDQHEKKNATISVLLKEITSLISKNKENKGNETYSFLEFGDVSPVLDSKGTKEFTKDISGRHLNEDEIKLSNKENQEFHKKLSILAGYPHLMRVMGWIADFSIDTSTETGATDFIKSLKDVAIKENSRGLIKLDLSGVFDMIRKKKIGADLDKWTNFINEIDFKTPWTYFNPEDFSIKYSEVLEKEYFKVTDGFIDRNGSLKLTASQFDVMDLVGRKLSELNKTDKDQITHALEKPEGSASATERSTGISVFVPGKSLETAIGANPDAFNLRLSKDKVQLLGEANINDYIIFGHNIDTGYRIDVAKQVGENLGEFYSLCKRVADYAVDTSKVISVGKTEKFLRGYKDEPWIAESAQRGKSQQLFVSEELFRWNNWSLTCPHIGNYEVEKGEGHFEYNDLGLENIRPECETLLPLRFGEKYTFRVRMVDLCGNGPQLDDNKGKTNDLNIDADTPYLRFEPVEPVELLFDHTIYDIKVTKRHHKEIQPDGTEKKHTYVETEKFLRHHHAGETLTVLVVRSNVSLHGLVDPTKSECRRFISPPRVTPQLAELHGEFDAMDNSKVYSLLANEKEEFKQVTNYGTRGKKEIPYVTDPNAKKFILDVPFLEVNSLVALASGKSTYSDREFTPLHLKHGVNSLSTDKETSFEISLMPGLHLQGYLYPVVDSGQWTRPGEPVPIYTNNTDPKARIMANPQNLFTYNNVMLPVGGSLSIQLVHAVQRPIFVSDALSPLNSKDRLVRFIGLKAKDRTPYSPVTVKMAFEGENWQIPMRTTGRFSLIAEYNNLVRDPKNENGNGYKEDKKYVVFHDFSNLEEFSRPLDKSGIPSLKFDGEDAKTFLDTFEGLPHTFGDTKYRKVGYKLRLESKFKGYFGENKDEDFYSRYFQLGIVNKESKVPEQVIKSSQRPKALQIDKIVHLFNWEEKRGFDGDEFKKKAKEVTRKNHTFRVYFNDEDWFSTGPDESIAVLYADGADTIDDDLNGLVSEFGVDPSISSLQAGGRIPTKGINRTMLGGTVAGDVNYTKVGMNDPGKIDFIDARVFEREKSKFAAGATVTNPKGFHKISAKIFPVKFDQTTDQFYCDIETIGMDVDYYCPFLKFAIARYQENSITDYRYLASPGFEKMQETSYDYRFSNIVTTPQVQVQPERRVVIKKEKVEFFAMGMMKLDGAGKGSECYVIKEMNRTDEFLNLIQDNGIDLSSTLVVQRFPPGGFEIPRADCEGAKAVYIEEYEYYEVDGAFKVDEFKTLKEGQSQPALLENYNPRNDIRKRLIFTYKIDI